jgi:UDP-glucuronate decarboxylase
MTLAEKVRKLSGSSSKIIHKPLPPDDPKRRCPDITKAKQILGWSPNITLEEGLGRIISWFKSRLTSR